MFISVYASGTNVQRLAKCSKNIDGVLYTAYSQLEKTEPGMIKRKFFCTDVDKLKAAVEQEFTDVNILPSWTKVWGRPNANKDFIGKLLQSLVGEDSLRPELNLSALAEEQVDCFMLLVSANKKEMKQIADIAARYIPDYAVKVLNGDFTTNKNAQTETIQELNEAHNAGKKGMMIIANAMGSRSYSIGAIQATVIAFDRGSVDATTQKVSRCLTPPKKDNAMYDGSTEKEYGIIVDLSFDPNRAENIERIVLEEAIQIQRDGTDAEDFAQAVKYVLSSVNMFKVNEYGHPVEVTEEEMFKVFGDNDAMLRVADVSVDVAAAIETGMFDILANVTAGGKGAKDKKAVVGEGAKNAVTVGGNDSSGKNAAKDPDVKAAEKIINDAIHALNMSATSVYYLANCKGESYRDCLKNVSAIATQANEFADLFGVNATDVITLLDSGALNEPILDVIVQNSKPKAVDYLF